MRLLIVALYAQISVSKLFPDVVIEKSIRLKRQASGRYNVTIVQLLTTGQRGEVSCPAFVF